MCFGITHHKLNLYVTGRYNDTFILGTVYVEHDYYIIEWVGVNKCILLPTPI